MSDNKYVLIGVIVVLLAIIVSATMFLTSELKDVNNDSHEENSDISANVSGELSDNDGIYSGDEIDTEINTQASGENSEDDLTKTLPNFEYNFEDGTVDLGENWKDYLYGFSPSPEVYEAIYKPTQRKLKRVNGSGSTTWDGGGKTFTFDWLTIVLASDKSVYRTIYTPKVSNENDDIIALSKIQYNIKNGTVDLGEYWDKYVYTITSSLQDATIYTPKQRVLKKATDVKQVGREFEGLNLCIGLKENKNIYKVLNTYGEFPNFQYNPDTMTLDLGENWQNYQFCYEGTYGVAVIYNPSQRILHKRIGSGGGTAQFDCNSLKIMLKENNELYRIVDVAEKLPEFTYNTTNGTVDLGLEWDKYEYQSGSNPGDLATIYTPTQRVLTRVISYESGRNIFNSDYLKIRLKSNPTIYKVIHTPRIIPSLSYDRDTQSVDLGADWEKYEFSYYDAKSSSQIVYRPSQRVLKKDVSNEMRGTNGKTFAGDYVNVILRANKDVYQTVYAKD